MDVAVDGVDGWNAVRSGRYDLVVSDIDMPRMNGIQLVAHIKEDARLKAIPVIVVSYKDREEDRIRGLDVGAELLPDQEQLPRPDVPGYGGRPDWRGGELMDRSCDPWSCDPWLRLTSCGLASCAGLWLFPGPVRGEDLPG